MRNVAFMRRKIIVFAFLWLAFSRTALATMQLITNGGFESGMAAPWVLEPSGGGVEVGQGYLSMGNENNQIQYAYQTITFPTNLIGATLSLEYGVVSSNPNGDDTLTVAITDTDFNPLLNFGTIYSADTTTNYVYTATNFITYAGSNLLSSYAGQTVDLLFAVSTDTNYGYLTSFYITDVGLVAGTTADIPSNDDFTNATLIPSDGITNVVATTYASRETGEPYIVNKYDGHSLWWTWTSPGIGTVTINTAGSDFNTLLGVYTGTALTNLVVVTNSDGYKLSSGLAYVKFTASKGTQYYISLDGYDGQSGSADFTFIYATDLTPPKLTISSPTSKERWSNSVFNVTGKVTDKVGVTAVWYQLNTNAWSTNVNTANGYANWNVEVTNTPGTNTLKVYAVDQAGNVSATNSVSFIYVLSAPFSVQINGSGKISPNDAEVQLEISNNYSITATAGKGYVFSNWVSNTGVESNSPVLKFTMVTNLSYTVNFIPNPFTPAVGTYEGLFYNTNSNGVAKVSSGFFSAQVSGSGGFTAKFLQGSKSYPVAGQFSLTGGWSTNVIKSWENTTIALQLDLTSGQVLGGILTNSAWTTAAELQANRSVYSSSVRSPQAGLKYTLVLPGTNSAMQPGGNGFGSVTVNTSGTVAFSGTLGDGTKAAASAIESAQGQWPFYISLYSGNGMILGWLAFVDETNSDINGQLYWFKPPTATVYELGFTCELAAEGSVYSYTRDVPVLNPANGFVILTNGGLTTDITNEFALGDNNMATGSNKLHLTFATSTGLFQGSLTNSDSATISISGAVLQKQNIGLGLFLNGNQSGSVSLTPQ
jgi:hypothetical protein